LREKRLGVFGGRESTSVRQRKLGLRTVKAARPNAAVAAQRDAGFVERAIAECKRAIEVDPNFANPYNDIGAYLIEQGALDDAVPWLERAKRAPRYEPRHFPYLNLGRLYMAKGDLSQALREFREALKVHPHDALAEGAARMIRSRMN